MRSGAEGGDRLRQKLNIWSMYRSPTFIWASCHVMCTAVLIGWDPATPLLPAHFDLFYEGAIGQPWKTTSLCDPLGCGRNLDVAMDHRPLDGCALCSTSPRRCLSLLRTGLHDIIIYFSCPRPLKRGPGGRPRRTDRQDPSLLFLLCFDFLNNKAAQN